MDRLPFVTRVKELGTQRGKKCSDNVCGADQFQDASRRTAIDADHRIREVRLANRDRNAHGRVGATANKLARRGLAALDAALGLRCGNDLTLHQRTCCYTIHTDRDAAGFLADLHAISIDCDSLSRISDRDIYIGLSRRQRAVHRRQIRHS